MKPLIRAIVVYFALYGLGLLLMRFLELASPLPLWAVPLIGAVGMELVIASYRYERSAVGLRRGKALLALRLALLGILIWMLWQPAWTRKVQRVIDQEIVVLIDDSASMQLKDEGEDLTRLELAREALAASGLKEQLESRVKFREVVCGWDESTDLSGALNQVVEEVPPDQLAGVILLSDGRHNRPGSVEDAARRLGILDAPAAVFPAGSLVQPRDAAILSVEVPDSVYLGDRIRVAARLKFDGFRGKTASLKFLRGEEMIKEKQVQITLESERAEVRFQHVPEEGGIGEYRLELSQFEGERFEENNHWDFQTVVSDARTNVLLVDSSPRWEFRYLRNLFYGRDKSIHLQSVLLEPDRVSGQKKGQIAASASRPFGEANASRLPESEQEWRKFDVIILGDIGPEELSAREWKILERCVNERGALLVLVAGPRLMPHSFSDKVAQSLIPVEYGVSRRTYFGSEEEFFFGLTSAGKLHPVLQQADGQVRNEQIWKGFSQLRWRHPLKSVKPGAEVLLYARTVAEDGVVSDQLSLEKALQQISQRREEEEKKALLVTRQTGNGKVALLLSDRTWRLREGAGDLYHHRFWGQLVRWGAGPNLRAGTREIRLGTDQLTYTRDDSVKVMVRLWDANLTPLNDEEVEVGISLDGRSVARVALKHRENSNGFYEARVEWN